MASVDLKGLVKRYAGITTVHGIDLNIADKEFIVLVGPSGCGKSTTLRMIAGLEDVSGGTVSIGGRVVNNTAPKDRNIAMVFQNYALYPHMSVRQNMGFGLDVAGAPKAEVKARVDEAAAILGLEALLERKPGELSGGQRQRVAMGRAMVRRPQVFLFDEPLSNLDAKLRNTMRSEIKKLHQTVQTTVIYVTHDQVEAMTLADRIVIMKDGRIEQVGTPMEVYERPANLFVAGFIGAPAMNQMRGTVENGLARAFGFDTPAPGAAANQPIVLGIRPDDLLVAEGGQPSRVLLVEPLGSESIVTFDRDGQEVVVKLNARDIPALPKVGDILPLRPLANRLHVFDAVSGQAIRG
jgi:multiple sugar transport system ATP-binding protein